MSWEFEAAVFAWEGEGGWRFVRLPVDLAEDLRDSMLGPPRGFGSVRVAARIGDTTWETSVFPEKQSGSYLLPVKKAVRSVEGVQDGDVVRVQLTVDGADEGER